MLNLFVAEDNLYYAKSLINYILSMNKDIRLINLSTLVMTITLTNIILPVVYATMEFTSIPENILNGTTETKQGITNEFIKEEQNNLVTNEPIQEEQINSTKDETIKTEQNVIETEETNMTEFNNSSTEKIDDEEQLNIQGNLMMYLDF